ncbi:MAG: ThiF family adenylyltransferase [Blastocatellia bacterium]|nr:ThiF family adenylyltransferase [Blastocatellia bacterium]
MDRYSRHILFSGIGRTGQERLQAARVAIIGCGALGCLQVEMLARAGVGFLRVVDRDFIEYSNLQRQVLFDESDAAEQLPKAAAAAAHVSRINSDIQVEPIVADVRAANIEDLIADVDVVLDGTDNFETRYVINDACVKHHRPWIYGAAVGAFGLTMTVLPGETPCLRCLFADAPAPGTSPTCDTAGIILPAIATIVAAQVTEALKLLTGQREKLRGTLMQVDLWENSHQSIKLKGVREAGNCPCCVQRNFEFLAAASQQMTSTLCGRNAVQISPAQQGKAKLNLKEIKERLGSLGTVSGNPFLIRFQIDSYEMTIFPDARAIIKGTDDFTTARSLYAKYVGL